MNLNLEGKSSKLAWGLGIFGSLFFIASSIYLASPTVEHSLEDQEFQLISKLDEKVGLYERAFRRNRNILIAMDIDGFMNEKTFDDEGAVALNIWCDSNVKRKRWFVSLDGFKKFCALSMGDVLWLDKKDEKIIGKVGFLELERYQRFSKNLFPRFKLVWSDKAYEVWKSWCELQLSEPFSYENKNIKEVVKKNCLEDS